MNLERKNLTLALIVTLIMTLCSPVLFPSWRLQFFVPFLVILFYQKPYLFCAWSALLCGFGVDLLISETRIGFQAIAFCFTTCLLYNQRRNFFSDSFSTLPIMTFLFSVTATILQVLLVYIFDHKIAITKEWIWSDIVCMPALDASYAFSFFILPALLFGKPHRRASEYFMENP